MPTISDLRQRQALPLRAKVLMTQNRIREWYDHWSGDVYVSFSGGKDSTVLAHLVRDMYPEVPLVFSNTGLEYPEIQSFARSMGVEFVRPKMRFDEVISNYGYPIISKEVAEAVYYARRIRSVNGESTNKKTTHTMHKRPDLSGERTFERFCKTTEKKRGQFNGVFDRKGNATKNDGGGWSNGLESIRRRMFAGVGEVGEKSMFNKEKWLPLCRDTRFMISHYCCHVMKKRPMKKYQSESKRVPFIGTLAEESKLREQAWIMHGCNAFDSKKPTSQPMSFWTEQDVLQYIMENEIQIASVYGDIVATDNSGFEYEPLPGVDCKLKCSGCQRTGCVFCGFGAHLEKGETRFQRLAKTHPKQYDYCMRGGQWVDNPAYDPVAPEYDGEWKNWNPKKIWVPSKEGLGMKKVFDDCNQIYGKDFIRYE